MLWPRRRSRSRRQPPFLCYPSRKPGNWLHKMRDPSFSTDLTAAVALTIQIAFALCIILNVQLSQPRCRQGKAIACRTRPETRTEGSYYPGTSDNRRRDFPHLETRRRRSDGIALASFTLRCSPHIRHQSDSACRENDDGFPAVPEGSRRQAFSLTPLTACRCTIMRRLHENAGTRRANSNSRLGSIGENPAAHSRTFSADDPSLLNLISDFGSRKLGLAPRRARVMSPFPEPESREFGTARGRRALDGACVRLRERRYQPRLVK